MGWAGDKNRHSERGRRGAQGRPRYYCMHALRTYVPYRATALCVVARAAPGGGQVGRVGQARRCLGGRWSGAEIAGGLGGWMDGARVADGRARGHGRC